MEWILPARFLGDTFAAFDVDGREHLVVIVKATWTIPTDGSRPDFIVPPPPICIADEYYGEPGKSPLRQASDYARFKSRCDVLFDACAHAPGGKPVQELKVGVRIGNWQKEIRVLGNRKWQHGLMGLAPGKTEPFVSMPLNFGHAFGGTLEYGDKKNPGMECLLTNLAGIGWGGSHTWHKLVGKPVPNLEYPDDPVLSPEGKQRPAALGSVPGACEPRIRYVGTYGEAWRRDRSPLLPVDFDERFYQCAPEDQQIPYPCGGEEVCLRYLCAHQAEVNFELPPLKGMKVRVTRNDDSEQTLDALIDTLFFETESRRFSAIWRASTPLKRNMIEIDGIEIAPPEALLEMAA